MSRAITLVCVLGVVAVGGVLAGCADEGDHDRYHNPVSTIPQRTRLRTKRHERVVLGLAALAGVAAIGAERLAASRVVVRAWSAARSPADLAVLALQVGDASALDAPVVGIARLSGRAGCAVKACAALPDSARALVV